MNLSSFLFGNTHMKTNFDPAACSLLWKCYDIEWNSWQVEGYISWVFVVITDQHYIHFFRNCVQFFFNKTIHDVMMHIVTFTSF